MTLLPKFRLETFLSRWEFAARHHLTASDAESMTIADLLALEDGAADGLARSWLGYTPTFGSPDLLATIAGTYDGIVDDDILCFAGAEEGLYVAHHAILDNSSHAVVVTPNYQAAETVPTSICAVSGVPLDENKDWALDLGRVAAAIQPNTRLVSINFPHNPTGKIIDRATLEGLIALCRRHGVWLFSDEVYRSLGPDPDRHLPQVADIYERGLSLNVLSKAYGLPGLRIGWIATRDRELLQRMERFKHYLSICNAAPSEYLAGVAIRQRAMILARNNNIVRDNLVALDAFFEDHADLFAWRRPDGGCVAFPRYIGPGPVEQMTAHLLQEAGILLLPSSIYASDLSATPTDRFRIGCGRRATDAGLLAWRAYLGATQD